MSAIVLKITEQAQHQRGDTTLSLSKGDQVLITNDKKTILDFTAEQTCTVYIWIHIQEPLT